MRDKEYEAQWKVRGHVVKAGTERKGKVDVECGHHKGGAPLEIAVVSNA
jgi:hypothetical protein